MTTPTTPTLQKLTGAQVVRSFVITFPSWPIGVQYKPTGRIQFRMSEDSYVGLELYISGLGKDTQKAIDALPRVPSLSPGSTSDSYRVLALVAPTTAEPRGRIVIPETGLYLPVYIAVDPAIILTKKASWAQDPDPAQDDDDPDPDEEENC